MASDPFDFSDVFTTIETGIERLMHDPMIHELASRTFAEQTHEDVYGQYEALYYVRRGESGGLADYNNYEVINTGRMEITVYNNTTGNDVYAPPKSQGYDSGYINDIIEQGAGYHWTNSEIYKKQPFPRPFMQKAADAFMDNNLLPMIHNMFFDD